MDHEETNSSKLLDDWRLIAFGCLTLGLAPYMPEPHIWGKLKWVFGDASSMQVIDWFDLLFHGLPWILLIRLGLITIKKGNNE